MGLPHEALTSRILEAAFEVSNELGAGFLESVYERALQIALIQRGIKVERQSPIQVMFRSEEVGQFFADLLVEDQIILELKAVHSLAPEHQAQVLNYLKATGHPVAMLLNFGTPKLEVRRFDNRFVQQG
jgi:GxxExxY protein